jgi:hypothetical protein
MPIRLIRKHLRRKIHLTPPHNLRTHGLKLLLARRKRKPRNKSMRRPPTQASCSWSLISGGSESSTPNTLSAVNKSAIPSYIAEGPRIPRPNSLIALATRSSGPRNSFKSYSLRFASYVDNLTSAHTSQKPAAIPGSTRRSKRPVLRLVPCDLPARTFLVRRIARGDLLLL